MISPNLFVHVTIVIQFLHAPSVWIVPRHVNAWLRFIFCVLFFSSPSWSSYSTCLQWQSQFLEPPTDLTVASTPIISILTSRIRGASLRTSRVFIDIICSNGLVKLIWERVLQDFERINGYLGSTKSQEVHYFSSTTWEMSLPRKKKLSSGNQHECILGVSAATSAVISLTSHIVIWKTNCHMACTCDHTCKLYYVASWTCPAIHLGVQGS